MLLLLACETSLSLHATGLFRVHRLGAMGSARQSFPPMTQGLCLKGGQGLVEAAFYGGDEALGVEVEEAVMRAACSGGGSFGASGGA